MAANNAAQMPRVQFLHGVRLLFCLVLYLGSAIKFKYRATGGPDSDKNKDQSFTLNAQVELLAKLRECFALPPSPTSRPSRLYSARR